MANKLLKMEIFIRVLSMMINLKAMGHRYGEVVINAKEILLKVN